jgi:hypothetical protein
VAYRQQLQQQLAVTAAPLAQRATRAAADAARRCSANGAPVDQEPSRQACKAAAAVPLAATEPHTGAAAESAAAAGPAMGTVRGELSGGAALIKAVSEAAAPAAELGAAAPRDFVFRMNPITVEEVSGSEDAEGIEQDKEDAEHDEDERRAAARQADQAASKGTGQGAAANSALSGPYGVTCKPAITRQ